MNDSYDGSLPRTASGMAASLVITTMRSTHGILPFRTSSSGNSVASMNSTRSAAWLTMYSSCSGNSRGLIVCITAPMHETA